MTGGALVRCPVCPGRPGLDAPAGTDVRKCVCCQGEQRWLPLPHPADHLCAVCRSTCSRCKAPAGSGPGGLCVVCRGQCRMCDGPLPEPGSRPEKFEAPGRREHDRPRYYFTAPAGRGLCDGCRHGYPSAEQRALQALPPALIRACGGTTPKAAMDLVRSQLQHGVPAHRLAERIERRWFQRWAHRPLSRPRTDQSEPYGPDEVAVWLVAPGGCPAGCEDGWLADDPGRPCPVCRPAAVHRAIAEPQPNTEVAREIAATARAALQAGKPRPRSGGWVPTAATAGRAQQEARLRELAEQPRARPATQRRPEISPAEERADPRWAAALRYARQERARSPRARGRRTWSPSARCAWTT